VYVFLHEYVDKLVCLLGLELISQLSVMVEKAKKDASSSKFPLSTYRMLTNSQVADIFYWCIVLKVNTEAFFRTLELYDR
jgi:hypothetical protein